MVILVRLLTGLLFQSHVVAENPCLDLRKRYLTFVRDACGGSLTSSPETLGTGFRMAKTDITQG